MDTEFFSYWALVGTYFCGFPYGFPGPFLVFQDNIQLSRVIPEFTSENQKFSKTILESSGGRRGPQNGVSSLVKQPRAELWPELPGGALHPAPSLSRGDLDWGLKVQSACHADLFLIMPCTTVLLDKCDFYGLLKCFSSQSDLRPLNTPQRGSLARTALSLTVMAVSPFQSPVTERTLSGM